MLQTSGGAVLVTDAVPNGGVIAILADKSKKELLNGLDRPFGMAVWKEYLYVSEAESIKRYKFNGKTLEIGAGEEVVSLKGYNKAHWTRSIQFDKTGQKMYISIGSGSTKRNQCGRRHPHWFLICRQAAGLPETVSYA